MMPANDRHDGNIRKVVVMGLMLRLACAILALALPISAASAQKEPLGGRPASAKPSRRKFAPTGTPWNVLAMRT